MINPVTLGQLHLICGLPGSGKTTLSPQLKVQYGGTVFSPDESIARRLVDHTDRLEMDRLRALIEQEQWLATLELLRSKSTVILENGFWIREERRRLANQVKQLGAQTTLHFLDVPLAVLIQRIEQRNNHLPSGSFEVNIVELQGWYRAFETPDEAELNMYDNFIRYTH